LKTGSNSFKQNVKRVWDRDDHEAGVDSGQSLHFRLEQEPETIF